MRPLRIGLRTLHIGAACVVLGGAHFHQDPGGFGPLLLLSGLAIAATDLFKYGLPWFRFLAAQAVVLKLVLLGVGLAWPPVLLPCLWAALVLGAVFSHASGALRHYALFGRSGPCAEPPS